MKKEDSLLKTTIESSFIVPYNENDQKKGNGNDENI